jgi:hypothetical protein
MPGVPMRPKLRCIFFRSPCADTMLAGICPCASYWGETRIAHLWGLYKMSAGATFVVRRDELMYQMDQSLEARP